MELGEFSFTCRFYQIQQAYGRLKQHIPLSAHHGNR